MRSLRHFSLCGTLVLGAVVLAAGSMSAPGHFLSTGEIYAVSAAGGMRRAVGPGADPVVSPDGQLIAYVRDGRVWLMEADGSDQRRLTTNGAGRPL
jgi:hypothetical protein